MTAREFKGLEITGRIDTDPKEIRHIMIDYDITPKQLAALTGYSYNSVIRSLKRERISGRVYLAYIRAIKEWVEAKERG